MEEYLVFAKDLAHKAGEIMLEHFKQGIERDIKTDATPVTIADTKINKLVIDSVAERFPEHSVLGEEESSEESNTEYVWVCDPIDGTIPYTLGIPTNLFSIALVKNGESVLGVLYDPYLDRMYEATKSNGAFLNSKKIRVNNEVTPQGYITIPGMQYGLIDIPSLLKEAVSSGMRSLTPGSVTYESMLVASGQIVAVIFPGKTPWDIAAVKVVVEEAGGKVTDLSGKGQRYDSSIRGAVVSNGRMHDQLVALVKKHFL